MQVKLSSVRVAFPAFFEAKAFRGEGEPRFGGKFPIEPGSANAKTLDAAMLDVARAKWGKDGDKILAELKKKDRVCYHESEYANEAGDTYDGFEDKHYLSVGGKVRPTVLNRDKTPLTEKDGVIYSGCFVNLIFEMWAQDNKYGKRINADIKGVQFVKDGDSFGGSSKPASVDDFEEVPAEEVDDLVA